MKAQRKDEMRKTSSNPWRRSVAFAGIGAVLASLISPAIVSAATAATSGATLKVAVVRDLNANGLADGASEPGVAGIQVQLIDGSGQAVTELTDSSGVATFAPSAQLTGGRYRVEASIPASLDYLAPALIDPTSTASNRFVPLTTQVDLSAVTDQTLTMGVWNPNDFVADNPELVTAQGWGNAFGNISAQHAVMGFNYNDRTDNNNQSTPGKLGAGDNLATAGQVGSVWGVAAQGRNQVYVASYNRWGVDVGPGGRGAIYKVNVNGQGPSSDVFATVADAGVPYQTPNALDASLAQLPETVGFFESIGREGLGGLEISGNGDRLYTVNLNTKSLVTIPINADGTAGSQASTPIANPACPGGEQNWRPWGLKVKDGDVYVGGVCSAETSGDTNDLRAVVYKVNALAPVFTAGKIIVNNTLNQVRGADTVDIDDVSGTLTGCSADFNTYGWRAWTDVPSKWGYCSPFQATDFGETNYPTPLLTDIDVQTDGSLVLGFGNRTTFQLGANSYTIDGSHRTGFGGPGDINKVCLTKGDYVWEGDAGCALPPSQSWSESAGGTTPEPEFFSGDFWAPAHYETTGGGLRYLPGQQYLVTNSIDPRDLDPYANVGSAQGVLWLDNTTGRKPDGADNTNSPTSGVDFQQVNHMGADANFGKAMSMGDIAVLANNAPLQIGNYVWIDSNGNGVQDPDEKAAPAVTVHLFATDENGNRTGAPIATAVTNADGEYYFDSAHDGLQPGTKYVIAVDNPADYQASGPLADYKPTVPNTGQDTLAGRDANDSDGIPSTDRARQIDAKRGGFPEVAVTTGNEGQNNHTYDFGFTTVDGVVIVKGDVAGNAADVPADAVGFVGGERRELSFTVSNTGSSELENVVVTDSTVAGG
ncbi:SdrD B-like domain-containing protein, partial [Leifsonia sp. NPDC058248]|uniref:SdrD B-like domain-containing protein n=1 Tax=Leifsonia sp. NPDC058248 TaxID=3346402 RepID=UPI0036DA97EB